MRQQDNLPSYQNLLFGPFSPLIGWSVRPVGGEDTCCDKTDVDGDRAVTLEVQKQGDEVPMII